MQIETSMSLFEMPRAQLLQAARVWCARHGNWEGRLVQGYPEGLALLGSGLVGAQRASLFPAPKGMVVRG